MLLPGTHMPMITFLLIFIETLILFYLIIYKLARPRDKQALLNIILVTALIVYNIATGLVVQPGHPQTNYDLGFISYATAYLTASYFPYYLYKTFGLRYLRYHAYKGVFYFLLIPYVIYAGIFFFTGNLQLAKNLMLLVILYALWVIHSLVKSVREKYANNMGSRDSKEEIAVLFLSLTPWVVMPLIDYFLVDQAISSVISNTGFLLMLALHVKRHIRAVGIEHQRLLDSERHLLSLNHDLQVKVAHITKELKQIYEINQHSFVSFSKDQQTPLALLNISLQEYMESEMATDGLSTVKESINQLSNDIENLLVLGKSYKQFSAVNQNILFNFSVLLKNSLSLVLTALQGAIKPPAVDLAADQQVLEKRLKHYQLTRRELQIVQLVIEGQLHKEIAERLFISERTVGKHIQNVFEKIGVSNKIELIHRIKFA